MKMKYTKEKKYEISEKTMKLLKDHKEALARFDVNYWSEGCPEKKGKLYISAYSITLWSSKSKDYLSIPIPNIKNWNGDAVKIRFEYGIWKEGSKEVSEMRWVEIKSYQAKDILFLFQKIILIEHPKEEKETEIGLYRFKQFTESLEFRSTSPSAPLVQLETSDTPRPKLITQKHIHDSDNNNLPRPITQPVFGISAN